MRVSELCLTGGGQWRLDFRSGCDGLHWSGLFGRQLLQTDSSLLKHLLHRVLFLEDLLDLVLVDNPQSSRPLKATIQAVKRLNVSTDPELSCERCFVLAEDAATVG